MRRTVRTRPRTAKRSAAYSVNMFVSVIAFTETNTVRIFITCTHVVASRKQAR